MSVNKPDLNKIYLGDCIETMRQWPDGFINCAVTSPPYWGLRDYGHSGQIGLEDTPQAFVSRIVDVFREVKRVLRDDGTLWLNLGDSYAANRGYQVPDSKHVDVGNHKGMKAESFGMKPKDLVGIPWSVAFALRADGWYLRQDIIWHKPNPMPESVMDRCTKSHEYVFLMAKSERYYYDNVAIKERASSEPHAPGNKKLDNSRNDQESMGNELGSDGMRNKRSVWTVTTKPFSEAHFATYPEDLIEPMIMAGCPAGGIVLDPFMGAGTTALVSARLNRQFIGCELNPEYKAIADRRIAGEVAQGKMF